MKFGDIERNNVGNKSLAVLAMSDTTFGANFFYVILVLAIYSNFIFVITFKLKFRIRFYLFCDVSNKELDLIL